MYKFFLLGFFMTIQIACSEKEYSVKEGYIERDGYKIVYSI
jgi:hypothetical protein